MQLFQTCVTTFAFGQFQRMCQSAVVTLNNDTAVVRSRNKLLYNAVKRFVCVENIFAG